MKKKIKKILMSCFLLLLVCTLTLTSTKAVSTVHALASWTPQTGFMPGIGIPNYDFDPPTTVLPPPVNLDFDTTDYLDAYDSLRIYNYAVDKTWDGGWKHAYFVEYLDIKRTDGRKIYDDDGKLDVRFHTSSGFSPSDEIIDYESEIWIKTRVADYDYGGAFSSVRNSKFSDAYFEIGFDRGEDQDDCFTSDVHDLNANTMKSGNYRNNGINPGDE